LEARSRGEFARPCEITAEHPVQSARRKFLQFCTPLSGESSLTCTNPPREALISLRLAQIHQRLGDIAKIELGSAMAGGKGKAAQGHFEPERNRLVAETDILLDEMKAINGSLPLE
jgi:hypothetical protein